MGAAEQDPRVRRLAGERTGARADWVRPRHQLKAVCVGDLQPGRVAHAPLATAPRPSPFPHPPLRSLPPALPHLALSVDPIA